MTIQRKDLGGERAEMAHPAPHPPSSLYAHSLASQPSGAYLPSPGPLPLGAWDRKMDRGWDLSFEPRPSAQQQRGPSFLSRIKLAPYFREAAGGNCHLPPPGRRSWPHLGWQDSDLLTEMSSNLLPFSRAGGHRVRVDTARRAQSRLGGPLPSAHPAPNPTSPFP